jgi:hypothetical protein
MSRKHIVWGLLAAVGLGYYYLPKLHLAEKFAPRIQSGLEHALHCKVKFDKVNFNFLPGPGFAVDEVVIYDAPSADLEPIAYVSSLEMRVGLLSLLGGKMEFTNLRLVEPSVNLKRTSKGGWNVQPFLSHAMISAGQSSQGLDIQVRSGRLNFKFGEEKSVFYITDADLDIETSSRSPGGFEIVFSGAPARTDRAAQGFGRLTGRGVWKPAANSESEVDFKVTLQKSSIGEITVLIAGRDFGIHGLAASEASLVGPLSNILVTGHAVLSDIHRWDLMAGKSEGWPVDYNGVLDFRNQRLNIVTTPPKDSKAPEPVAVRFSIHDFLSQPRWSALVSLHDLRADPLLAVARHMGVGISEKLSLDGKVQGVFGYSTASGFQGGLRMSEATAKTPDGEAMKIPAAQIHISRNRAELRPARFELSEKRHADLEAAVDFDSQAVELTVSTPGLGVRDIEVFSKLMGIAPAPVLQNCSQGLWRGVLRWEDGWKGDLELSGAVLELPDLAGPVEIASASVQIRGPRFTMSRIRGKAGKLRFEGEFQWLPKAPRAAHFRLRAAEASAEELDRLLAPVLRRQQGLLARTFGLNRAPVPDWLATRHAEGEVAIGAFTVAGKKLENLSLAIEWDAIKASVKEVEFSVDNARAAGSATADLAYALPVFQLTGALQGPGIHLARDLEVESVSGKFTFQPLRTASQLKASDLELVSDRETYTGQGGSTQEGRLLFDFTSGKKTLRLVGKLSPLALETAPARSPN